jgi:hypothetical protein
MNAGVEVQCGADFLGKRMQEGLEDILDKAAGKTSSGMGTQLPQRPTICC